MFWGPYHLWGQFLECPPLLLNQESLPSLPSFSPHSQLTEQKWGIMVIEGYVLGSPPLVGVSFGMPTSSVGPRVPPSLLPLTPSHSPHSLFPPLTPTLLHLAPLLLCLTSNDTREARSLSLTEDLSLLKASKGSQGLLRPQEGPRGPGRRGGKEE